jgi:hypothetical protein
MKKVYKTCETSLSKQIFALFLKVNKRVKALKTYFAKKYPKIPKDMDIQLQKS